MVATTDENNIKGLLSGWGLSARSCDNCRTASALLYCRADAAFLCGPCDSHIHQPRMGAPAHERVWVCEVCEQVPAEVHCKADVAWLCSTCDHDVHSVNPLAQRHDRVPITPIADSPIDSRSAASSAFLVPDELDAVPNPPSLLSDDSDGWLIPNPNTSFLYNESELLNFSYGCDNSNCQNIEKPPQFQQQYETKPIVDHSTYNFTDSVVPTQSHNSNNHPFSHHSESNSLFQNCFNIDFSQPNKLHKKTHNNNNSSLFSTSSFNYSAQNSVSSSDIGVVPDNANSGNSMSEVSYSFARSTAGNEGGGSTVMDREAKVLRYREKRKNRKFQKTIRYASRKAYAETRPRIKGRFAKRTEAGETLSDLDFAGDNGYGVVPAFC